METSIIDRILERDFTMEDTISMLEAAKQKWPEEVKKITNLLKENLTDSKTNEILLKKEIENLPEGERQLLDKYFQKINASIKFGKDGYLLEYIYIIYRCQGLSRAESAVATILGSAADLKQYFLDKADKVFLSKEEFEAVFKPRLQQENVNIDDNIINKIVSCYNKLSFVLFAYVEELCNLDGEICKKIRDIFNQVKYEIIRNNIFN